MVVQQSCTAIKVFHYNFSQEVGLDPLFTDTDVPGQYGVEHLRQKKTSTAYSTDEACQVIAIHLLLRLTHTS